MPTRRPIRRVRYTRPTEIQERARRRLARARLNPTSSADFTWRRDQARCEFGIEETIEAALVGSRLNPNVVSALATRKASSHSRNRLVRQLPLRDNHAVGNVLSDLADPWLLPTTLLFRIACAFGVLNSSSRIIAAFDLEPNVRARDTQAARVALALWGKPVAPWSKLGREERAAVLLRAVVLAMRGSAPP